MFSEYPLVARNTDGIPRVVSIGRLSKPKDTEEETKQSLQSMRAQDEKFLDAQFPVPKFVDFLGEQSSGMIPDRDTMKELWSRIKAKQCDVVVSEDISRIFRNPRLQWDFVQDAVAVVVFRFALPAVGQHRPQQLVGFASAALTEAASIVLDTPGFQSWCVLR